MLSFEEIQAELREVFGVPFELWRPGSPWVLVPTSPSADRVQVLPVELKQQLEAASSDYQRPGNPVLAETGDGQHYLAIPLQSFSQDMMVAVGCVSSSGAQLVKTAALFQEAVGQRAEIHRYRKDLEICAAQIGDDFEELTFLRNLTEQLDISDTSHGAWQVAQLVLPLLSPLIQSEALVLLPSDRTATGKDHAHPPRPGAPAVWVGPRRIDEQTCCRLVEFLSSGGETQTLVNNHFDRAPATSDFPNVNEIVLVPLAKSGEILGWLLALNRTHRKIPKPDGARWELSDSEFGTVEASLLESVASMLATHVRNVQLFREKEALLVNVVRAMVSAIDAKDPYTCGHSERVALVGQRLGKQLGLGPRECERLYLTGLLHDVGKIGVSDAVLRKPGKLTEEEFAEIKRHPDQGWSILQELDQLNYVFPGVLHHHESYNGKGYPDGLAGEAIPFPARILAVADAYDAMISDRPYRQGMPHEKVEAILREGSGSQWDPKVIDALFEALPQIRASWQAYQPHAAPTRMPRTVAPFEMPLVAESAAAAN